MFWKYLPLHREEIWIPWKSNFMKHYRKGSDLEWCVLINTRKGTVLFSLPRLIFEEVIVPSLFWPFWIEPATIQLFVFLIKLLKGMELCHDLECPVLGVVIISILYVRRELCTLPVLQINKSWKKRNRLLWIAIKLCKLWLVKLSDRLGWNTTKFLWRFAIKASHWSSHRTDSQVLPSAS